MIELTKLNKEKFFINVNLIETIESTPDTLITITNGKTYYVLESIDEVVTRVDEFYRRVFITVKKFKREARDE